MKQLVTKEQAREIFNEYLKDSDYKNFNSENAPSFNLLMGYFCEEGFTKENALVITAALAMAGVKMVSSEDGTITINSEIDKDGRKITEIK